MVLCLYNSFQDSHSERVPKFFFPTFVSDYNNPEPYGEQRYESQPEQGSYREEQQHLCLHKRKDVIQTLHGEVNKLMEELTSANISIGQLTAEGQSKQEKLDKLAKVYGEVKSDLKTSNFTVQNLTGSLNDTKVSLNDTIQAKCVVDEKLAITPIYIVINSIYLCEREVYIP